MGICARQPETALDSWQEQSDVSYQWFTENKRAEVLYDTCLKNVIEPGDDEQGRDLHTTFDQVLCKNVVFE